MLGYLVMSTLIALRDLAGITSTEEKAWVLLALNAAQFENFSIEDVVSVSDPLSWLVDLNAINDSVLNLPVLSVSDVIERENIPAIDLYARYGKRPYYSYFEAKGIYNEPEPVDYW